MLPLPNLCPSQEMLSTPINHRLIDKIFEGLSHLGIVMGPVIGGLFSEYVTWRWCFLINLTIGAFTVLPAFIVVGIPEQGLNFSWLPHDEHPERGLKFSWLLNACSADSTRRRSAAHRHWAVLRFWAIQNYTPMRSEASRCLVGHPYAMHPDDGNLRRHNLSVDVFPGDPELHPDAKWAFSEYPRDTHRQSSIGSC